MKDLLKEVAEIFICLSVNMAIFLPVEQLLLMMMRRAWHTVSLRSGRSLMAIPSTRAMPLKEVSRSTGHVQKPGSMVQIWRKSTRMNFSWTPSLKPWQPQTDFSDVHVKIPAAVVLHRLWLQVSVLLAPIRPLQHNDEILISFWIINWVKQLH